MYWSVWAGAGDISQGGRIERAQMDGSKRSTLLGDSLHWPAGLTVHPDTEAGVQALYW